MEVKERGYNLVTRKCEDCIYFSEYVSLLDGHKQIETYCHLTPRERSVRPDYWCSHGVWYEWSEEVGRWEPHMHGEIIPPKPTSLEEIRRLMEGGDDSE